MHGVRRSNIVQVVPTACFLMKPINFTWVRQTAACFGPEWSNSSFEMITRNSGSE